MKTEMTAVDEKAWATAEPKGGPVLMERLQGGRGIVRVGDIVTPATEDALFKGWTELTIAKIGGDATPDGTPIIYWKAPDGVTSGGTIAVRLRLTSASEMQARAQLESVMEMVAALEGANVTRAGEEPETARCNMMAAAEDAARETIQQDALRVEVRSGWRTPGAGPEADTEFKILLCAGGPAVRIGVRIIGELNEHGEPKKARLEHQDWGTPWTEYRLTSDEENAVLAYCSEFYFA